MSDADRYVFQLFVADNASNSVQALNNLRAICRLHLPDRHRIDIVDVLAEPMRALSERIFMTPTLIIRQPGPTRRLVGNLSETATVLGALGIESPV